MTPAQRTTARATRWLLPVAVTVLFGVIVVAAALQGTPSFSPGDLDLGGETERTPPPMPSLPPPEHGDEPDRTVLRIVFQVITVLAGLALAAFLVVILVRLIRRLRVLRRPRRREGAETAAAASQDAVADEAETVHEPTVRRGIDGALRRIDEERIPADAITAAWVGLEEAASDAGMTRGAAETPSEFTARLIGRREGVAEETRRLLRLYENVRFGGYRAGEQDRSSARDDLTRIREAWG